MRGNLLAAVLFCSLVLGCSHPNPVLLLDNRGGFSHGGWTGPYWHDDMGAYLLEEIKKSDTLLLGRRTWQGHAEAFEPAPADDPFAGLLNGMRKYVVSTTLKSADAWA